LFRSRFITPFISAILVLTPSFSADTSGRAQEPVFSSPGVLGRIINQEPQQDANAGIVSAVEDTTVAHKRLALGWGIAATQNTIQLMAAEDAPVLPPIEAGLWDAGFSRPILRSDIGDASVITIGDCLYQGVCPEGVLCSGCPQNPPIVYSRSNYFAQGFPQPSGPFTVIDANNEVQFGVGAFDPVCNSGPPNQSLPVGTRRAEGNVFTVEVTDMPGRTVDSQEKRVYLTLQNHLNPCHVIIDAYGNITGRAVPYLGFGFDKIRGNVDEYGREKPLGYVTLRSSNYGDIQNDTWLRFKAGMEECSTDAPCLFYLNIVAAWGGKPHLVVLTFGKIRHDGGQRHAHWNWPVIESRFYNGYDIGYVHSENVGIMPLMGVPAAGTYEFSLGQILQWAGDHWLFDSKLPVGETVEIITVSWAIETIAPQSVVRSEDRSLNVNRVWLERMDAQAVPSIESLNVSFSNNPSVPRVNAVLSESDPLYGTVTGLTQDNVRSCLEVAGRPADQVNGFGWCEDITHWVSVESVNEIGQWHYDSDGVWRVTFSRVGSVFEPGTYYNYWRNMASGMMQRAEFTVYDSDAAYPVFSFSSTYDTSSRGIVYVVPGETLYGRVDTMPATNVQGCLEVASRPAGEQNGSGWCNDPAHRIMIVNNRDPGQWYYENGGWNVAVAPVGNLFPEAGTYIIYFYDMLRGISVQATVIVTANASTVSSAAE
jgi:hypothetical protein